MGRRGCASAMGMIKFPSSCSSPKALCNQFIDYYICSRGVFCINHIKLRNFVVITIECSIATVDRGSIMTRIYRWSMMVYSSLQAEFMVTKYDGHIHRYIFCNTYIVYMYIYTHTHIGCGFREFLKDGIKVLAQQWEIQREWRLIWWLNLL